MAISKNVPTYRQLNPNGFFGPDACLIEEGAAFEFDGEPNEHMEALNEPARLRLEEFYTKLDASSKAVAKKYGHAFLSMAKDASSQIGQATADARRLETRPGDGGIPLMGGKGLGTVKRVALNPGTPVLRMGA